MSYDFNPTQSYGNGGKGGSNGSGSNIDFNAVTDYTLEALGGEGTKQLIGVISNIYEIGIQTQERQEIEWNSKVEAEQGWRFEKLDDGSQKDPTASIIKLPRKGKQVDCLVYDRNPTTQAVIVVDFPEVLMNVGQFYDENGGGEEKPFRAIIGENGFIPRSRFGLSYVVKPFNLGHTNVNRQKKNADPHYAIAKNSLLAKIADWTESLDSEGYFHANDLGKLIGKAINFDVEVKLETWDKSDGTQGKKLVIDAVPSSKLSVRDQKAFDSELDGIVDDSMCGVLMFNGDNDPETIKQLRKKVFNTMCMATNWEGSKLQEQIRAEKPDWFEGDAYTKYTKFGETSVSDEAPEKTSKPVKTNTSTNVPKSNNKPAQPEPEPTDIDFDDDIPF